LSEFRGVKRGKQNSALWQDDSAIHHKAFQDIVADPDYCVM
jgi:hypothetical protein